MPGNYYCTSRITRHSASPVYAGKVWQYKYGPDGGTWSLEDKEPQHARFRFSHGRDTPSEGSWTSKTAHSDLYEPFPDSEYNSLSLTFGGSPLPFPPDNGLTELTGLDLDLPSHPDARVSPSPTTLFTSLSSPLYSQSPFLSPLYSQPPFLSPSVPHHLPPSSPSISSSAYEPLSSPTVEEPRSLPFDFSSEPVDVNTACLLCGKADPEDPVIPGWCEHVFCRK